MLGEARGSPLLPAAPTLSGFRYQRWGEKKGVCRQRQEQIKEGCPGFCASGAVSPVPGWVMPPTRNVAAKCLPKKQGVQSRLSEQRYFFKNACLGQTLRSTAQLWRHHSLLTKPPRAQLTPPRAASGSLGQLTILRSGQCPGQLLTRAPAPEGSGSRLMGATRKQEGKKATGPSTAAARGCGCGDGQGRACGQGRFSIILLESVILRWVRCERVAVSFLSASISMVTRGTRDPSLKYTLPPVLPSG